jgi:hypothetical protein
MSSNYGSTTDQLFSLAGQAMSQAATAKGSITFTTKPNLLRPTVDIDVEDKTFGAPPQFSDLFSGVNNTDTLITGLNDKVDAWLAKYFPSINGQFQNVPEDYLVKVISGVQPYGDHRTVFDLVWQQARDRAYKTTRTETRTLEQNFSARGFTLPSGALLDAITQSEQRATDAILNVNRDQAIKDLDLKADLLKHAVGIAAQLKMGILNTSAEFFKAYYNAYNLGNDTARIKADAYRAFYGALAEYYNVEVNWEQLRIRAAEATANVALGNDRNQVSMYSPDAANQALGQAARAFGDVASGAAAAAGTLVAQIENK